MKMGGSTPATQVSSMRRSSRGKHDWTPHPPAMPLLRSAVVDHRHGHLHGRHVRPVRQERGVTLPQPEFPALQAEFDKLNHEVLKARPASKTGQLGHGVIVLTVHRAIRGTDILGPWTTWYFGSRGPELGHYLSL